MSALRMRSLAVECGASGILVLGVIASGLVLAPLDGSPFLSALARSIAVGLLVGTVLWTFSRIGGAQIHPLLAIGSMVGGGLGARDGLQRLACQLLGAIGAGLLAVWLLPPELTVTGMAGVSMASVLVRELVVAFAFVLAAWGTVGRPKASTFPLVLGVLAGLAYWMSGSHAAAHPLTTLTRLFSDPSEWPFVAGTSTAQVFGAVLATIVGRWLFHTSHAAVLTCRRPT